MALVTSIHNLNSRFPDQRKNRLKLLTGRVTDVILDPSSIPIPIQNRVGGNIGVGAVFFDLLQYPSDDRDGKGKYQNLIAYPLFANNIQYPLPNELISVIFLPGVVENDIQSLQNAPNMASSVAYYISTVNIWRNFHHNIFPSPLIDNDKLYDSSDNHSYQEIESGAYDTENFSYNTPVNGVNFPEKSLLKDLQPYIGDIIYKGRWGQSIRFGSTITGSINPNPWSSEGEGGSPITIIRNGQPTVPTNIDDPTNPDPLLQVEDINNDISSIYLTSTQVLPFTPSSANYSSYTTQVNDVKNPSPPTVYNGNQIILTSNRLFFNASEDSILLSSKESINLNTLSSINLESKKGIVLFPGKEDSSKIYLGGITAQDTVIKGNKFLDDFDQLLSQIRSLAKALQSDIGSSVPNVPNPIVAPAAKLLELHVNSMARDMENYKSKTTRII
jgi:hypothetical protein